MPLSVNVPSLATLTLLASLNGCVRPLPPPTRAAIDETAPHVGALVYERHSANRAEDLAANSDGVPHRDGHADAIFRTRLSGPVTALALIISDPKGNPGYLDCWDTLLGPMRNRYSPMGLPCEVGARSWTLAVVDSKGTLLNPKGSLPPNLVFHDETVTIHASDPHGNYIFAGRSFVLMVFRPGGKATRTTTSLL